MSALDELLNENNWETKEEYGRYGSYYAHNWTGNAPPLDDAAAELAQLRAALGQQELECRAWERASENYKKACIELRTALKEARKIIEEMPYFWLSDAGKLRRLEFLEAHPEEMRNEMP